MIEEFYTNVLSPLIRSLYSEVMIIGMFIVGYGNVRIAIQNLKVIQTGEFWRRILLLSAIMIFSLYLVLSYNFETIVPDVHYSKISSVSITSLFVLLVPLELIMVGITGFMFLVLSLQTFKNLDAWKTNTTLKVELTFLFAAAALWHLCCIFWWLFWIGSDKFSPYSVWIHVIVVAIHTMSFSIWRILTTSRRYKRKHNIYDWFGTIWFAGIMIALYILRMSWYIETM